MSDRGRYALLSILIPTLRQRETGFRLLSEKLRAQIRRHELENAVEIVSCVDGGEMPTGEKRNWLVAKAQGVFVVGVDDDDEVHPEYVPIIVDTLRRDLTIDCIGITGRITFRDRRSRTFVYSNRFREYRTRKGVYERPPHHLNPIRADIARAYPFEPVWKAEDSDWAMRMSRDGALKRETFVSEELYHYCSRRSWMYQAALDWTEFIRHPLGLQLRNRLRIRRWLRRLRNKTPRAS